MRGRAEEGLADRGDFEEHSVADIGVLRGPAGVPKSGAPADLARELHRLGGRLEQVLSHLRGSTLVFEVSLDLA